MAWIYDTLVQDEEDISGQFAYLFYKHEKRKRAEYLKQTGDSDDEIAIKLRKYQDTVATDPENIKVFKEGGAKRLQDFLQAMQDATLEEARRKFLQEHQEIGQAVRDLDKLVGQKRGLGQRFTSWLLIGMRSWLSTAIWGMIIGGLLLSLAWLVAPQGTEEAAKGFWDKAMDGLSHFIDCQKSSAPPECRE